MQPLLKKWCTIINWQRKISGRKQNICIKRYKKRLPK